MTYRFILVAALLLTATLPLTVSAQDASEWETVTIPTSGNAPTQIMTDSGGGKIGAIFTYGAGTGEIAFVLHENDAWTLQELDLTGATVRTALDLEWGGGDRWFLLVHDGTMTCSIWISTNDGDSWTATSGSFTACAGSQADMDYVGDDKLAIVYFTSGGTTEAWLTVTPDAGVSYTQNYELSDNNGSPGGTPTAQLTMSAGGVAIKTTPSLWIVYLYASGPATVYAITSADSGFFWSTYQTTGTQQSPGATCTNSAGPIEVEGDGTPIAAWQATAATCTKVHGTGGIFNSIPIGGSYNSYGKLIDGNVDDQYLAVKRDGGTSVCRVYYKSNTAASWTNVFTTDAGTCIFDGGRYSIEVSNTQGCLLYRDETFGGRLQASCADVFAGIQATDTIATPNLSGFDVDASGIVVITRQGSPGDTIHTYNAKNLAAGQVATVSIADCNRVDGVSAVTTSRDTYVAYLKCDNAGLVNEINIRSTSLTDPNLECATCSDATIEETSNIQIPDGMRELGTISSTPYSFERFSTAGTNHGTAAFTFSDLEGRIGAYAVTVNNADSDLDDVDRVTMDPSAAPQIDQLCTWTFDTNDDGDPGDFIGGVTQQGTTGFYRVTVDVGGVGAEAPTVNIETLLIPATLSQSSGIACAEDRALIVRSEAGGESLYLVKPFASPPSVTLIEEDFDGATRGVALSTDGNFAAYVDGTSAKLLDLTNTSNIQQTGTVQLTDSGNFFMMKMDQHGANLWVANSGPSGTVTRYDVSAATCASGSLNNCTITQDDFGNDLPGSDTGGTSDPGDSCGFVAICTNAEAPTGFTSDAFNFLLGVLFVAALAAGFYFALGKSVLGAGMGGATGFFGGFAFGLFPLWAVLLVVLIAAAVVVFRFKGGA